MNANRALGQQVVGQHIPLAAGTVQIQNRVEDHPYGQNSAEAEGILAERLTICI